MIQEPSNLDYSSKHYNTFGTSSSTNNDRVSLHSVISDLHVQQKFVCKFCGRIGHKANLCIIYGYNFFLTSFNIKTNKSNAIHGDEPNELPIECNIQPLEFHFKYRTPNPNTSPVILDLMGRLNNHAVDTGDVYFYTSEYPLEYISEYVTYLDNNPIKSSNDDEVDHILQLFHS